jgi:hypothetical protein
VVQVLGITNLDFLEVVEVEELRILVEVQAHNPLQAAQQDLDTLEDQEIILAPMHIREEAEEQVAPV